nr:MAG TPA: hypothetical protein [Caudoviricetes sp.]
MQTGILGISQRRGFCDLQPTRTADVSRRKFCQKTRLTRLR